MAPPAPTLQSRATVCNRDCPDACRIVATVRRQPDGTERVVRLQGDPDHPITQGFLCHRTSHFLDTQYSPARLTRPLLRKDGALVPVSWEQALDVAAERLLAIRAESGPAAIFHYRSGGSLGLLKHLSDYFFERFGPCTTKRGDICSGAGDAAQMLDFGDEDSNDVSDLDHARGIVLWGKNVYTSSPHLLPVLRRARERGARLVLIDPVHQRTASLCHDFVQVRPGGDFDLAMAVAALLFARGWAVPDAAEFCAHLDELRALAGSRTVGEWCARADVSPAQAESLAQLLGPGRPTAILVGWGMGRRGNGAGVVRALDALGAISGNLGTPGGGVSFYFKRRGAFDLSFITGSAPRTVCEPLFGREVLAMRDPPIRAVWVTAGNPVAMLPESLTTARALESRELVVVVDSFLTDTARRAHLVLPTTTLLEGDDLLGAYGHHYLGASTPVVAPPAGVRSDLEILQGLAARVGLAEVMAGSARQWKERMVAPRLGPHGITVAQLEAGPVKSPLAPPVLFADRRFKTGSGKVELITAAPPPAPSPPAEFPLLLMALSTDRAQSSQWARPPRGLPVATVHPAAAGAIAHGARCRLESRIAHLEVELRHDASQRRDVVLMAKGGHLATGHCANALVEAAVTDLGEGGALYDQPVRLVPLPSL